MGRPRKTQKEREILGVVGPLFAAKGYHATSMREIARALGMNQSTLYHYFTNKEEILFRIMDEAMNDALSVLKEICDSDLMPEQKLNRVLGFYTRYYAGDQERLTLLVNEMNSLGRHSHRVLVEKQREYVLLVESILRELAAEGKMKPIHSSVATFAFFGMVHYTIKWYRKEGAVEPDELAGEFVEIFTRGILK